MTEPAIAIEGVDHAFGEGPLRRQVLFDVRAEIRQGEILLLTGPSGSGKTTLLTLIGALRSAQSGSLRVLGHELRGASEESLVEVRRSIGYVFQAHNLLDALTAVQNVQLSLELHGDIPDDVREERSLAALERVGLADRAQQHPSQLSGGERQRVAIARALVGSPQILLADEPTASLDKQTGRSVVELIRHLAKERGVTVVLVTHDNRILDVADRILALEDGRISSLMKAVASDTERMLDTLTRDIRKGELIRRVEQMDERGFGQYLEEVTAETRRLLDIVELTQETAFESMLEQVLGAFSSKAREILQAERAALYLLDEERAEVWSFVTCEHGRPLEVRLPRQAGLVGQVADTGKGIVVAEVRSDPAFDAELDRRLGTETRNVLAVPIAGSEGEVFAVAEVANKRTGLAPFDERDRDRLTAMTDSMGLLLEAWWRMSCQCRSHGVGRGSSCCGSPWRHPSGPRRSS